MTGPEDPTLRPTPPASERSVLESLVAACLEARMAGDRTREEELLSARPELAIEVRTQLADLARSGLLDEEPQSIGPYRVIELLGRGGMGEVFLAEQREPVQRRVAVKLVKRGMDTREILARFAAERQALARMSHPGIARVYDAGSTADGRPWFAMEHVPGLPLTAYCDRKQLDTEARLALFLAVCDGVQHAHLKGFLHRDLKPSNLLVTEVDGKPTVKVIDFGIAKAIDERGTGATVHTLQGAVLGTPEYMSPEQAERDGLDLDLRTDIYSLGVVLYELLTGELPFAAERLRTDLPRLQRILREEDPAAPSRRITTKGPDTAERAKRRRTTTQKLQRRLRGDLDWICLKALAKDRDERYASVGELVADIHRHLSNEPVLAGPPSGFYRLRKYIQRHRLQVVAAALVLLALIAGLVVSSIYRARAEDAAERAEQAASLARSAAAQASAAGEAERRSRLDEQVAREAAERGFSQALESLGILIHAVEEELYGAPRLEQVRRKLLETARDSCRELIAQRGEDPRAQRTAAIAQELLASAALTAGDSTAALQEVQRAEEHWIRALRTATGDAGELRFQRARTLDLWGQILAERGRDEDARAKLEEALAEYRSAVDLRPDDTTARKYFAVSLGQLAHTLARPDPPRAAELFAEARAALEQASARGAETLWVARLRAVIESNAISPLFNLGRLEEAEEALRSARAALRIFDLDASWDLDLLEAAAEVERKASILEFRSGRRAEGVASARAYLTHLERLCQRHPETETYRVQLVDGYGNLAVMLVDEADPTPSLEAFRSAVQECEALWREHPENQELARIFARCAGNHAHALFLTGRREHLAEARRTSAQALQLGGSAPSAPATNPAVLDRHANLYLHRADVERADGDAATALPFAEQALALLQENTALVGRHPQLLQLLLSSAVLTAHCALDAGSAERARSPLDLALELLSSREAELRTLEEHVALRRATAELEARWFLAQGDALGAEAAVRRFHAACEDAPAICSSIELELLVEVALLAEGALRSDLLARAELGARTALTELDAALEGAPEAEQRAYRVRRARAQLATARLRILGGEPSAAHALLEPALEELLRSQREEHVDRDAERWLAFALELRVEESRGEQLSERALRAARALCALADPRAVARGAELLIELGATNEAIELLVQRAQRAPALRLEDFAAPALESLRAEPRFRAALAARD
ncbi:MAG: serine/threonine protein kinase [Planctomycetes bacterium]|nr:serine/threonine protein kinase [Planctomycetota bacterium]